ncbi:MAG: thioredoxin family protein [Myxococcaceae bacterium]
MRRLPLPVLALAALALVAGCRKKPGNDWNEAQISWQSFDDGLAAAARTRQPICLVFTTDWCPHCTNYRAIFKDAAVVARASSFVMIRVDSDKHPELSRRFAPDGEYIPRTLFLSPDGVLEPSVHPPRTRSMYFYDERDPSDLLSGMNAALQLHVD